jgi:hypothetical protein
MTSDDPVVLVDQDGIGEAEFLDGTCDLGDLGF